MKLHYFLLPAALLFAACGNEELEGVQNNLPITSNTTTLNSVDPIFPKEDGSMKLSTDQSQAVSQLLKYVDPSKALNMNELEITDAQYNEIKRFVNQKLKGSDDYTTYCNIFNWLVKNLKYATGTQIPYLNPYEVFKNKVCVCQGYANLLKTMCHTQGIPCANVNGYIPEGAHAWNYVYAGGQWIVSDATNDRDYKADRVNDYNQIFCPIRLDFTLFEDDQCEYTYNNSLLNVDRVKDTNSTSFTVPYSVNGLRIMSFIPSKKLPESITQLNIGSNIYSFGEGDELTTTLGGFLANVEEINVDPKNSEFNTYKGVVYSRYNPEWPLLIPAGIRSLKLKAIKVMEKNIVANLDKLEELVIAEGTERIEDYAVERCPNLKRVYVPGTVTSISKDAFYNCGNYEIINVPTSIHEVTR